MTLATWRNAVSNACGACSEDDSLRNNSTMSLVQAHIRCQRQIVPVCFVIGHVLCRIRELRTVSRYQRCLVSALSGNPVEQFDTDFDDTRSTTIFREKTTVVASSRMTPFRFLFPPLVPIPHHHDHPLAHAKTTTPSPALLLFLLLTHTTRRHKRPYTIHHARTHVRTHAYAHTHTHTHHGFQIRVSVSGQEQSQWLSSLR